MLWKKLVISFFFTCLALSLTACSWTQYQGALDRSIQPPALGLAEIPAFDYDRATPDIAAEVKENKKNYQVYFVKIRKNDFSLRSKNARAFYFEQKTAPGEKRPLLICLPPTGGPIELAKGFAEYYAEQGFHTITFYRREMFFNPKKDLEYNVNLIRQSVIDVRRALDYLAQKPNVDMDRVAVMGVSLGGIIASLVSEADGRVKATAMLVSSGNLPKIMATSQYGRVARLRNGLMEQYKLGCREELIKYARQSMAVVDPITYADRLDPARVLMINGYQDNIIKISAAEDTWRAMGQPEWRTLPVGHYSSFILIGQAKRWTLAHFRKVLGLAS